MDSNVKREMRDSFGRNVERPWQGDWRVGNHRKLREAQVPLLLPLVNEKSPLRSTSCKTNGLSNSD